jgi:hypothetical protein
MEFGAWYKVKDIISKTDFLIVQVINNIHVVQRHCPESFGTLIPGRVWDSNISPN